MLEANVDPPPTSRNSSTISTIGLRTYSGGFSGGLKYDVGRMAELHDVVYSCGSALKPKFSSRAEANEAERAKVRSNMDKVTSI